MYKMKFLHALKEFNRTGKVELEKLIMGALPYFKETLEKHECPESIERALSGLRYKCDEEIQTLEKMTNSVLSKLMKSKPEALISYEILNRPPNPLAISTSSLDRFKTFVQFLKMVQATRGDSERFASVKKFVQKLPLADRNLYEDSIEFFSVPEFYSDFFYAFDNHPSYFPTQAKTDFFRILNKEHLGMREWVQRFKAEVTYEFYEMASRYADSLSQIISRAGSDKFNDLMVDLHLQLEDEKKELLKIDPPENILGTLHVELNPRSTRMLVKDKVNCCITSGKSREAQFRYTLDKSVHLVYFSAGGVVWKKAEAPFGLAIFVEATGHSIVTKEEHRYLVLEGFPANDAYYKRIGELREYTQNFGFRTPTKGFTTPRLVYFSALITAKLLGISKLFVNCEHRGVQQSVEDVVRTAAVECRLPSDHWDWDAKHGEFKLLKEQYTHKDFATINVLVGEETKKFEYTHALQKPALPPDLVNKIRQDPERNGEGYFDTWYGWNKFIMETHDSWPDELKENHLYAEAVSKRGKDPQWNLGIGYCKGFEVDVEKECKRLGIF